MAVVGWPPVLDVVMSAKMSVFTAFRSRLLDSLAQLKPFPMGSLRESSVEVSTDPAGSATRAWFDMLWIAAALLTLPPIGHSVITLKKLEARRVSLIALNGMAFDLSTLAGIAEF